MRRPLRPSEEGCGEMEVMGGATPKGLDDTGVGETPLLEMVLPGVTAIPGAGDEPESQRWFGLVLWLFSPQGGN